MFTLISCLQGWGRYIVSHPCSRALQKFQLALTLATVAAAVVILVVVWPRLSARSAHMCVEVPQWLARTSGMSSVN